MKIPNELLLECIEKDVIKSILHTKIVSEALNKLNVETEEKQKQIRKGLVTESIKKKLRILKGELGDVGTRRRYTTNFLTALLTEKGLKENELDTITEKMTLQEASYFLSYFSNCTKITHLYEIKLKDHKKNIKKHLKKIDRKFIENKFRELEKSNSHYKNHKFSTSEYGSPILRKLKSKPIPHVIYFEDSNCIFFDFWTIGEEQVYFDSKEGDYVPVFPRQQVICRIYKKQSIMELQPINSNSRNIDNVLTYLMTLLKNDEIYFRETGVISNAQFRSIEPHLKKSHEKHEGNETSSALTRTHTDGDTRRDTQLHPIINRRPFSVLNGSTEEISNVDYPVMISLNKSGYFMIKTKTTTPSERKNIIRWLWGFLS
jgi:hypothetical protein